ncbi:uncharacterized protein LOC130735470 [Lotus japonicus]|uniref:uncharacterized protein LOC130735470 n=1 Tax=Lotus japonicus TaxID=34305 RepID=UPI0025834DBF|nr:uncharacterized protein LOC130735470 [Lotus japonicus]
MLGFVLDLVTQAASSSAFIFCCCNLIIVIILLDLKPSISVHQESEVLVSVGENQKQGTSFKCLVEEDKGSLSQVAEVSHLMEAETEGKPADNIETQINEDHRNEEEEKVEEEDDELRRRVEEFIEKINKGWKEELFCTSNRAYESNSKEIYAQRLGY